MKQLFGFFLASCLLVQIGFSQSATAFLTSPSSTYASSGGTATFTATVAYPTPDASPSAILMPYNCPLAGRSPVRAEPPPRPNPSSVIIYLSGRSPLFPSVRCNSPLSSIIRPVCRVIKWSRCHRPFRIIAPPQRGPSPLPFPRSPSPPGALPSPPLFFNNLLPSTSGPRATTLNSRSSPPAPLRRAFSGAKTAQISSAPPTPA